MSEEINVLCATDDAYVPVCGIMLTSLFENNKKNNIYVYVFVSRLAEKNKTNLEKLADHYQQQIKIIEIAQEQFRNCPIRFEDYVSICTYYRLCAPMFLPESIDKILYIDCDTIVMDDLAPLWRLDISNHSMGVCYDEAYFDAEKYSRLKLSKSHKYFNAGVLLINLRYWRQHRIMDLCLNYITHNISRIKWHDQDTLNAILYDSITYIHPQYNLQTAFLYKRVFFEKLDSSVRREIGTAIGAPVIIHFTGPAKPWNRSDFNHPYSKIFEEFHHISFWKDALPPPRKKLAERIRLLKAHLIWGMGLREVFEPFIITKQIPINSKTKVS